MPGPVQGANRPIPGSARNAARSSLVKLVHDAIHDLDLTKDSRDELFTDWGSDDPYHIRVGRGECAS